MKILLAGEGGQGVQTIAKILTKAVKESGKNITYLPGFGVEQRGGVSLAFIKISSVPILYPRFTQADIIVAFSNRSPEATQGYLGENTIFIYDDSAIETEKLALIEDKIRKFIKLSAQKIAQEKHSIKSANMILLGALLNYIEIDPQIVEDQILEEFKNKIAENPEIKDININAFREGKANAKENDRNTLSGKEDKKIDQDFSDNQKKWQRFPEYCKGCGLCIVRCPVHAIKFSSDLGFLNNPLPVVDINKCIACGKCMEICPDAAIKVEKISSQQVE